MALPTLTRASFQGSLLVNWQTERFEQYITEMYALIVRDCIGDEAYIDANLTTADKWTDLFAGGAYYHVVLEKQQFNDGLTSAVKYFLWSAFNSDYFVPTNSAGLKKPNSENSDRLSNNSNARVVQSRYNSGVLVMQNLLMYVENYIDFSQAIDSFVDNGGGSYTINTTETIYLASGDTVSIAGTEYVVSNVVADTSFDITSTSATSFTGNYISNPYEDVCIGLIKAMI